MELEVSQKVRAAIKAKLVELGVHVDEELPDYIMVLIANRRNPSQMESDLNLFLGEQTHRFVGWLTHVLKKLEEVTAGSTPQQQKKRKSSTSEPQKPEHQEPEKKKKKPEKEQEQKLEVKSPKKVTPKHSPPPDNLEKMRSELLSQRPKPRQISPMRRSRSRSPKRRETRKHKPDKRVSPQRSRSPPKRPPSPRSRSPPKRPKSPQRSRSPPKRPPSPHRSRSPPRRSPQKPRRSRSRSPVQLQRRDKPRSSVFERLLNKRVNPPSTSPPRRVLSSVVVKKHLTRSPPKLQSTIVKIEPQKTLKIDKPSKLLLKAVTEANADACKITRKVEDKIRDKVTAPLDKVRREVEPLRKPIHERLGKRVVSNIHERIGYADNLYTENITVTVGHEEYDPEVVEEYDPEYVEREGFGETDVFEQTQSPPPSPTTSQTSLPIPRISIALNDDTTSEEEEEAQEQDNSPSHQQAPEEDKEETQEDEIILQETTEIPSEPEQDQVASDLREKLVKRHNAKKQEKQEEKAEVPQPPQPPQVPASQPEPIKPPTVIITPTPQTQITKPLPQPPCKYNPCLKPNCPFTHTYKPPIYCKFAESCTNKFCKFKHPKKINPAIPAPSPGTCRYFPACKDVNCKFYHPAYCKFGSLCTNNGCKFYHEGRVGIVGGKFVMNTGLPQRNLLKWEKK